MLFLNVSYPYPICLHVIIYFIGVLESFLCNLCKGVLDVLLDLLKFLQQPWCIKTPVSILPTVSVRSCDVCMFMALRSP